MTTLTQEIQEMSYQDFVAKLVKPGDVMDKEISEQEESLMNLVEQICSHASSLSYNVFQEPSFEENISRSQLLEAKHMCFGLLGEAGELLDAIKKILFYRKSHTDIINGSSIAKNVLEEIGDLMFYHTGYNTICIETELLDVDELLIELIDEFLLLWNTLYPTSKITIETAIQYNKEKLAKRYASLSYSDKQANDRADKQ